MSVGELFLENDGSSINDDEMLSKTWIGHREQWVDSGKFSLNNNKNDYEFGRRSDTVSQMGIHLDFLAII